MPQEPTDQEYIKARARMRLVHDGREQRPYTALEIAAIRCAPLLRVQAKEPPPVIVGTRYNGEADE